MNTLLVQTVYGNSENELNAICYCTVRPRQLVQ